jgi:hypothetical protein
MMGTEIPLIASQCSSSKEITVCEACAASVERAVCWYCVCMYLTLLFVRQRIGQRLMGRRVR